MASLTKPRFSVAGASIQPDLNPAPELLGSMIKVQHPLHIGREPRVEQTPQAFGSITQPHNAGRLLNALPTPSKPHPRPKLVEGTHDSNQATLFQACNELACPIHVGNQPRQNTDLDFTIDRLAAGATLLRPKGHHHPIPAHD